MVQRKPLPAEDAFKQALALNPNQADGLHGYSQLVAALGRIKESLAMRDHLQDVEQSIINYTADTAEIVWLDGDTKKAIAMLKPFSPGRTLELALIEASAGPYREAAAEIRFIPASNYPPGMEDAAAKLLEFAPVRAAAPETLPRLGNLKFVFLHVGAPARVLEYYQDEVRGDYFQPISATWFWHPTTPRFDKPCSLKPWCATSALSIIGVPGAGRRNASPKARRISPVSESLTRPGAGSGRGCGRMALGITPPPVSHVP